MSNAPSEGFPSLPAGFRFGTSTASYQIEGAAAEDGRGPSIWDTFCAQPGRIADGTDGSIAADHYHRYRQDIELMKRLGTTDYRLSVSWPRIQPTGSGAVNAKGLDFYDRLIDELCAADIAPMLTLYHWDLPQGLEDDGGWINRDTVERFAQYAAIVGDRFADRVAHWVPINEPNVHSFLGYATGVHAPGRRLMFDSLWVSHHLLLAHGRAAIELRRAGASSVGCANNHAPVWPASEDDADVGASKLFDALWNGMFIEPMLLGRYPADLSPLLEGLVEPGDMATIRQPLDFYGVNYYNPMRVAAAGEDAELPFDFRDVLGHGVTDLDWPIVPEALREWLIMFRARFRAALPPIVITESGAAYNTEPDEAGVVEDQARIEYLDLHVRAVAEAISRGVDIRGYYCWSFIDNFEWAEGLVPRFGLVHVNYQTLERTPKKSFQWYADLIAAQPSATGDDS